MYFTSFHQEKILKSTAHNPVLKKFAHHSLPHVYLGLMISTHHQSMKRVDINPWPRYQYLTYTFMGLSSTYAGGRIQHRSLKYRSTVLWNYISYIWVYGIYRSDFNTQSMQKTYNSTRCKVERHKITQTVKPLQGVGLIFTMRVTCRSKLLLSQFF